MKLNLLGCLFPVFLLVAVGQFAADEQTAGRKVASAEDGDFSTVVRDQNAQKLEGGMVIDFDKENTITRQEEVLPREGVELEGAYQNHVAAEVDDVMLETRAKEGDGKVDIEGNYHSVPMKVGHEILVKYDKPNPVESKEERGGDEEDEVLAGVDSAIQRNVDEMEDVYDTIARYEGVSLRESVKPEGTHQKQVPAEVDNMSKIRAKEREADDDNKIKKIGHKDLIYKPDHVYLIVDKEEQSGNEKEELLAGVERATPTNPNEEKHKEHKHQKKNEEREDHLVPDHNEEVLAIVESANPKNTDEDDREEESDLVGNDEVVDGVDNATQRSTNEEKINKQQLKYKERDDEPVQEKNEKVLASAESETPRHTNEEISKKDTHLKKKERKKQSVPDENVDVIAREESETLENTNVGERKDADTTIARDENMLYSETIKPDNDEQKVRDTEEHLPETRENLDNDSKLVRDGDVGYKELSEKHYQSEPMEKVVEEYANSGLKMDGYSSATEDADTNKGHEKDTNPRVIEGTEANDRRKMVESSSATEDVQTNDDQGKEDHPNAIEDAETMDGHEKDDNSIVTEDADTRYGRENVGYSVVTQDEETNASYEKEVNYLADEEPDTINRLEKDTENVGYQNIIEADNYNSVSKDQAKDTNLVRVDRSENSRIKISKLDDKRIVRETDNVVYNEDVSEEGGVSNSIRDEEITAANGDDNEVHALKLVDFEEDVRKQIIDNSEEKGDFCWSSMEDDEWATVEDDNEEVADNRSCKKESLIDFLDWEPRPLIDIAEEVENNRLPRHQHINQHTHCPPCWAWVYGWQMPPNCQVCSPDWAMLNSWCQWCRWDSSNWICRWLLWCF